MIKNKTKGWSEPVATPSPEAGIYGLGATYLYGNSEEGSTTEKQPGKIRHTRESRHLITE